MSKVVVKGLDVPVDEIKPSPYQPRLAFDLEDIKGSIMRDGILVTLTVRKKDGFYEMVDGERRWRVARDLGYETVPCDVIDIDDDTARRMVWKVNTLRKDYEPKEKAHFFKKMQDPPYGMSVKGIAREYDTGMRTVNAYLNVFKLPDEYQQMVWDKVIPIRNIRELQPLFNGVARATPDDNPEIFEILDRSARERHFGAEQIREAIKPSLAKLRAERVEKAKEALAEVEPEVEIPKTPEELEEAAKALRARAKELKTPEQILEEKREKARGALLTGRDNALSKVEKAKGLGIDTTQFDERVKEIEAKIIADPDEAYDEAKMLKKAIDKAIRDFEEKRKEAELREKLMKEARVKAEEELLKDKEFLRKAAELAPAIEEIYGREERPALPAPPPEELEAVRERVRETTEWIREILERPEVKERGLLYRNLVAHEALLDVLGSATCPICGASWESLVWKCHGLNLKEAYEMASEKYRETLKEGK